MITRYSTYNESLRDKMTPVSHEKVDKFIKEKLPLALKSMADIMVTNGYCDDYYKANSILQDNEEYITDKLMSGLYPSQILSLLKITILGGKFESVRDKMTGLSDKQKEYEASFVLLMQKITRKFMINLQYVEDEPDCHIFIYDKVEDVDALVKWIEDNSIFTVKDYKVYDIGKYNKVKTVVIIISRLKEKVKMFESIRDKMTPTSLDEIKDNMVGKRFTASIGNRSIVKVTDIISDDNDIIVHYKYHNPRHELLKGKQVLNLDVFVRIYPVKVNESVKESIRDKMTPKSSQELVKGKTPHQILFLACEEDIPELIDIALERGADLKMVNNYSMTPLNVACRYGSTETAEWILKKGVDVDEPGPFGDTSLMFACGKGRTETVEMLIQNGADVNARDDSKMTALMKIVRTGHVETAELLIQNGADMKLKDKRGWTALSYSYGTFPMVNLLKKYGASE